MGSRGCGPPARGPPACDIDFEKPQLSARRRLAPALHQYRRCSVRACLRREGRRRQEGKGGSYRCYMSCSLAEIASVLSGLKNAQAYPLRLRAAIPGAAQLLLLQDNPPTPTPHTPPYSPRWEGLAHQAFSAAGCPENQGRPDVKVFQDGASVFINKHQGQRHGITVEKGFDRAAWPERTRLVFCFSFLKLRGM